MGSAHFSVLQGDRTLNMPDPELVDPFQKVSSERNSSHDSSVFDKMRMKLYSGIYAEGYRGRGNSWVLAGSRMIRLQRSFLHKPGRHGNPRSVRRKIANNGYSISTVRTQITT